MTVVGGYSAAKPADAEVSAMIDGLKASIGEKLGYAVDTIEVQTYQTQVVAGTNFSVQALVNGSTAITVKVFRPLPHTGAAAEVKEAGPTPAA